MANINQWAAIEAWKIRSTILNATLHKIFIIAKSWARYYCDIRNLKNNQKRKEGGYRAVAEISRHNRFFSALKFLTISLISYNW